MTTDLRWAVMGTGRIAGNVLPRIEAARGCRVVCVASRTAERAREFAGEVGLGVDAACTYDELLGRGDVEAVYVTLPNHLHVPWSKRLLEAGKHVLCEKPLTAFRAEAEEVFATARRAAGGGRRMVEGFMYMHHPQTERLIEIARAGEADGSVIGRLERIVGRFDIDLVGVPHAWTRFLHSMWGGALLDLGCYPIGLARLVMGREPRAIERTSVEWAAIPEGETKPVDLACGAELVFEGDEGDVRAICHCSMGAGDARHVLFRMEGTWGSVETGYPFGADPTCAILSVERNERHPDGAGNDEIVIEHGGERFENQFADFAAVVRGQGKLLPSPEWSIEQARVLERILSMIGLRFPA